MYRSRCRRRFSECISVLSLRFTASYNIYNDYSLDTHVLEQFWDPFNGHVTLIRESDGKRHHTSINISESFIIFHCSFIYAYEVEK